MKMYVEELPKSCEECPCCNECMDYGISCNLDDIKLSYYDYAKKRHINCPLQSISDYTKQVRKEVCEEIRQKIKDNIGVVLGDYNYYTLKYNETEVCKIDIINDILDQIQGE